MPQVCSCVFWYCNPTPETLRIGRKQTQTLKPIETLLLTVFWGAAAVLSRLGGPGHEAFKGFRAISLEKGSRGVSSALFRG